MQIMRIQKPTVTPVELTVLTLGGFWWGQKTDEHGLGLECSGPIKASAFIFKNLDTGEFTGVWKSRTGMPWHHEARESIIEDIVFGENNISFSVPGTMDEKPVYNFTRDRDVWAKWHMTVTGTKYGDTTGLLPVISSDGVAILLATKKKKIVQRHRPRLLSIGTFEDALLMADVTNCDLMTLLQAYNIPHPGDAGLMRALSEGRISTAKQALRRLEQGVYGPVARDCLIRIICDGLIEEDKKYE